MENEQQKHIDEVFRNALEEPAHVPDFEEQNWDALQEMLDGKKKPFKFIYWRPVITSAAAIILVALGWWYLVPQTAQNANNVQQIVTKQPKGMGTPHRGETAVTLQDDTLIAQKESQPGTVVKPVLVSAYSQPVFMDEPKYTANQQIDEKPVLGDAATDVKPTATQLKDETVQLTRITVPADSLPTVDVIAAVPNELAEAKAQIKGKEKKPIKPQLAINVLGATDMNGVSSFNSVGTGKNIGLLFSARFNKITISTGAYYSYKPYAMSFSQYSPSVAYKFKYTPESVIADCRMLDIPLNIDYQLYSKNRNTINIGTGISSYIMLRESYAYNYSGAYKGISSYDVKNPGQYFFGAVNFQASYQRQINSKLGIAVMPYVKIPLADVGYSRVRLQTAGVALGFNWNLNTLAKPK